MQGAQYREERCRAGIHHSPTPTGAPRVKQEALAVAGESGELGGGRGCGAGGGARQRPGLLNGGGNRWSPAVDRGRTQRPGSRAETSIQNKAERRRAREARGCGLLALVQPAMEGSPGVRHFSSSEGPGAPPKTAQAMEELQKLTLHMKETLDVLTPLELRNFRDILKKVDEEPRVTQVQLELEGDNTLKLARLLAKQYYASAPRVLTKVLQQLPRADLLPRWETAPAANGPVIPRKRARRSYDYVDGDLDHYDLSGSRRAFLMCVKKTRPGAGRDVELMEQWLGQCLFEYTLCIDPGKKEFIDTLTSFRDGLNEIKDEISCCLVTLMSHGENGFLKMKDDDKVSLESIFDMFNNKNCPALHEKPKIFIIQACRGERRDSGVETDDEPMDSDDISEKRRLPTFSDYFIIYPTQSDHVALRHPRTGSVMIQAMTDVFKEHGNKWHIADFFTKVNNQVVHTEFHLREEPVKVSLVMESTLTKSVYF